VVSRPIGPGQGGSGGWSGNEAAWIVPTVGGALLLSSAATWLGGTLAGLVEGHRLPAAHFTVMLILEVLRDGTGSRWPGVSPALVWSLTAALAVLLGAPLAAAMIRWVARRPAADDPRRSLARVRDLAHLTLPAAALGAVRLRPSLAGRGASDIDPADVGLALGRLHTRSTPKAGTAGATRSRPAGAGSAGKGVLYSSWEDVLLAYMAPRSGKSTALAIPAVLSAPGPVIATSNKADVWAATAALRAAETGERVWTFDPQQIAYAPRTWWWDPLEDLSSVEEAERLAGHFVLTVEDDRSKDIWGPAAQELLAALLLAARASGGTIHDVYEWLNDEANPTPVQILRDAGLRGIAASLAGTQGSPPETRGSVYFTARVAAKCLRNPQITAWITPPTSSVPAAPDNLAEHGGPDGPVRMEQFHAAAFPRTRQSLYLLSKDGGGSAAPLVAALTDRVMRAATLAAERAGGRLDPPMIVVLDEAANICRIADLPQLYSHLGSRGVIPLTILQSHAQGIGVWGETGMRALLSAATVKLVGAGIDDASFAEDLSRLIGDHDVTTVSINSGDGRLSRSRSVRQQRILPAAAIRALPKGQALVWLTGAKVALVHTLPWYEGPRAAQIAAHVDAAQTALRARAQTGTPAQQPVPTPIPELPAPPRDPAVQANTRSRMGRLRDVSRRRTARR
jgi:type IV secretory pathway TraG/TraD family ATPase VirD4